MLSVMLSGKECIIIDDMIDTAGTLVQACKALRANGATKIYACATHPVFSPPAIQRISVNVTNLIELL